MSIIEALKSYDDFIGGKGCDARRISKAEKQLGVVFAEDYKLYLKKIGLVYFDSHELTGIGAIDRLNVVSVTQEHRKNNENIPLDLYVIEDLGIDGAIIWQSTDGSIYQSVPNMEIEKIYNSLEEYVLHNKAEAE